MKKIIAILGFLGIVGTSGEVVSAAYFNAAPIARCQTQITRNLQVGSENNEVHLLQQVLLRAGFLTATPNGHFGPATFQAVQRFQGDNGISMTGKVTEATRNALNERLCDADLNGNFMVQNDYLFGDQTSDITYVDQVDPYVKVISPDVSAPIVYATPQTHTIPTYSSQNVIAPVYTNTSHGYVPATSQAIIQPSSSVISQGNSTSVIYSPQAGYLVGITPQSGSISIASPVANTVYKEGDTVNLSWSTSNLAIRGFQVLLENTTTGQSKVVPSATNLPSAARITSFVLTKELLDSVCAGTCDNNQQGSFRIVIATPVTDIAGITSTLRAVVAPITIKRPYANFATVSISASKTPVNSNEVFKLYVNIPTGASWDANLYGSYTFKIHALCPTSVTASIAGVPCGQDFSIPFAPSALQQEIPVVINNPTWYKQDLTFEIQVTNLAGQVIGRASTNVSVNNAPFTW